MYGLAAEFKSAEELVTAAEATRAAGYRDFDCYSPFPIDELVAPLGTHGDKVALVTLLGGLVGLGGAFFMQWYACVISYPVNIGGRPFFSWPAFIPVTFELTVLGAGLSAVFIGVLAFCGLPQLYHPIFNARRFERASQDAFFLCVEANDPLFERDLTWRFLEGLGPLALSEVPR